MSSSSFAPRVLTMITLVLGLCIAANAQASRTWVSGVGDDANPCSRTAPCKTFAGAISKTQAGGEIDALDPAGFGAVTITKAITLDGGAGVSSILTTVGNAININAGANDHVILRNLSLNGLNSASNGINFINGAQLVMTNLIIERFAGAGLFIKGNNAADPLRAEIVACQFHSNNVGLQQEDNTAVGMRDSTIVGTFPQGNLSFGVNMQPATGTAASLKLENNEISFTNSAIRATGTDLGKGNPTFFARNNHIFHNQVGVNLTNAVVYHSAGGNILSDNVTAISGGVNGGAQLF